MGGNRLTEVPSTLGQLTALQALVLCDNRLESLPSSIANLKNLKSLLLHKNILRTLPTEIITLKNLTEVKIFTLSRRKNVWCTNDLLQLLFQLSLRDNPLVVRFVTDMTHNPPSLLEIAARVVKTNEIPYTEEDLPRNLFSYLDSAHHCVNPRCQGTSIIKFIRKFMCKLIIRFFIFFLKSQVCSLIIESNTSSSSTFAVNTDCRYCNICAAVSV